MKLRKGARRRTEYSDIVKHGNGNYIPLRFDLTDGYLGVTETDGGAMVGNRILLSPTQVQALIDFVVIP